MADKNWKWGQFYCNPGDPVLMVPVRTGDMYSPNYARPSVWVVCGTFLLAAVGFFVQMGYATRAQDRETQRIDHELQREINCVSCTHSGR